MKPSICNPNSVSTVINRKAQLINCKYDFEYTLPKTMVAKIANVPE